MVENVIIISCVQTSCVGRNKNFFFLKTISCFFLGNKKQKTVSCCDAVNPKAYSGRQPTIAHQAICCRIPLSSPRVCYSRLCRYGPSGSHTTALSFTSWMEQPRPPACVSWPDSWQQSTVQWALTFNGLWIGLYLRPL